VRRRFGELRPGSAGLVIAKERLNRGPEGVNVMCFGGELNRVLGELQGQECKPRQAAGSGVKTPECWTGLVIPGAGDGRWRERCRWRYGDVDGSGRLL
jgi:hypothetical protein